MPTPLQVDLSAPSSQVVWALVDGSYLYRSRNGGTTWQQRPLPAPGQFAQPEISFVDDRDGWLTTGGSPATQCQGEGTAIYRTTDAGATWQLVTTVAENVPGFRQCKEGLSFVDTTNGFLGAWDPNSPPTIYRTSDGGLSWASSGLPDPPGFTTFGAGDALRAGLTRQFGETLLVPAWGNQPNFQMEKEYIFRSVDRGASWSYMATTGYGINNVVLTTESRWLRVQNGVWTETTDAGKTWHSYPSAYRSAGTDSSTFVFANPLVGYGTVDGVIQKTLDGGLHWMTISTPGS